MSKHKLDITKNHLSWEKTHFKKCDKNGCKHKGEYRAPKSRLMLNHYYFFCLEHIKEYNKSWNFYKGLSVSQIEKSVREDTIWNRPSWPLKGNPHKVIEQINEFFSNEFITSDEENKYFQNKILDKNLTSEENKALSTLKVDLPITLDKIKKNYKKLVKIFHPDVNGNNKKAEEKFKEINQSYKTLLQKFKNEQKV